MGASWKQSPWSAYTVRGPFWLSVDILKGLCCDQLHRGQRSIQLSRGGGHHRRWLRVAASSLIRTLLGAARRARGGKRAIGGDGCPRAGRGAWASVRCAGRAIALGRREF